MTDPAPRSSQGPPQSRDSTAALEQYASRENWAGRTKSDVIVASETGEVSAERESTMTGAALTVFPRRNEDRRARASKENMSDALARRRDEANECE